MREELRRLIYLFSNLMVELSKNGFVCPKPISNKDNNYISDFNDKKFMIVIFRWKIKKQFITI